MHIAIFADVHGRVELCFRLCDRWQRETGQQLDFILQAGDLGAFFDRGRLDRATIRHAQHDPSELGFLNDFTTYNERTAATLSATSCPLIFVRGNHEDHQALDALEREHAGQLFPIDVYQRVFCLKSGLPHALAAGGASLDLLGIGRVGPVDGEHDIHQPKYIQPYEQERIYRLGRQPVDLLLTHDSARHAVTRGYGMGEIRDVLDGYRPIYHFYGHTEESYYQRRDTNGVTLACKLSDLTWDDRHGGLLQAGAMAILTWHNRREHSLAVIDAPWLKEYGKHTWQYM
jgi:hypothetical protein